MANPRQADAIIELDTEQNRCVRPRRSPGPPIRSPIARPRILRPPCHGNTKSDVAQNADGTSCPSSLPVPGVTWDERSGSFGGRRDSLVQAEQVVRVVATPDGREPVWVGPRVPSRTRTSPSSPRKLTMYRKARLPDVMSNQPPRARLLTDMSIKKAAQSYLTPQALYGRASNAGPPRDTCRPRAEPEGPRTGR